MPLSLSGNGLITGFNPVTSGFGKVLQVVSTAKTDTFSSASSSLVDVTGLSVAITPASASNQVLVTLHLNVGTTTAGTTMFALLRGATQIALGDAASNRLRRTFIRYQANDGFILGTLSMTFLDSPATTSATTYKIQMNSTDSMTSYINRSANDTDSTNNSRGISTITVMEVAA